MRMRRKKNLDTYMTQYPDILFVPETEEKNTNLIIAQKEYLDLKKIFGDKEIELEIGCGKGAFICELARQNPDKGFIAVECCKNVIVDACKKVKEDGLTNILFICCGAQILPRFLPENSISRIYLNFSCPFPKSRFKNRRLTHYRFLESYKMYMKPDAEIHQKTDNMHLFEYSLEQYSVCGFKIKNLTFDLHKTNFEGNIITEYEKRFSDMGMPIYRVEAYR